MKLNKLVVWLCLILFLGMDRVWAKNGFISIFSRMKYEAYQEKKKKRQALVESRRLAEEEGRRQEELKRREKERRLMEQQVLKVEDYDEPDEENLDFIPEAPSLEDILYPKGRSILEVEEVPPVYELQGIVWDSDQNYAIINGKIYMVGDKISDKGELLSVLKDKVVIQYLTQTITVNIPMMHVNMQNLENDILESGGLGGLNSNDPLGDDLLGSLSVDSMLTLTVHE